MKVNSGIASDAFTQRVALSYFPTFVVVVLFYPCFPSFRVVRFLLFTCWRKMPLSLFCFVNYQDTNGEREKKDHHFHVFLRSYSHNFEFTFRTSTWNLETETSEVEVYKNEQEYCLKHRIEDVSFFLEGFCRCEFICTLEKKARPSNITQQERKRKPPFLSL